MKFIKEGSQGTIHASETGKNVLIGWHVLLSSPQPVPYRLPMAPVLTVIDYLGRELKM